MEIITKLNQRVLNRISSHLHSTVSLSSSGNAQTSQQTDASESQILQLTFEDSLFRLTGGENI
jgi:hypothetical protein